MFIIYLQTKFLMPTTSDSLAIAIKQESKCRFHIDSVLLFYILKKLKTAYFLSINKGSLKSSWIHLIILSQNFVEVWWQSLLWSTSLGKQWTSYNNPPTSWKHAADHLPQASGG